MPSLGRDEVSPIIYWNSQIGLTGSYIDFNGATAGVPYDTSIGYTFSTSLSLSTYGPTISKSLLIDLLVDQTIDNRDGELFMTASNITLNTESSNEIDSITASGTYSILFNMTDLALNSLHGVIFSLDVRV